MTTTVEVAEQELSKQLGDYWNSTTTSSGSSTAIIDTALKENPNDWPGETAFDMITSGTYDLEERKIVEYDMVDATLHTFAHGGTIASGVTYRVHRLFKGSDKKTALIAAARQVYPNLHKSIIDESITSHNWLKDGSFEIWTSSSALTHWTTATSTIAQTSTAYLFKHGAYSCKISTAAGSIKQSASNWDDLKYLVGKTVTFSIQAHCDTASCLRIAIYDGITTTYSSYHSGDSAWEPESTRLYATVQIAEDATVVEFQVLHESATGTSYVDDARVSGPSNPRIYIGNIGFAQNQPKQVLIERSNYVDTEPWTMIHGIEYDNVNGYMYLPNWVAPGYRLRMKGIGYLDFLASGVSSEAWTATIDVDSPQLDILVAQAALYLYTEMSMPNFMRGDREEYQKMIPFWRDKLRKAISQFGMDATPILVNRGR